MEYNEMTPIQEVFNAASMLLPSLVFGHKAISLWPDPWLTCLLVGGLMHLPASVSYHLLSARDGQKQHTDLRKVDQTMIYLSGAVFAFALSRGSVIYTAINSCYDTYAVFGLWSGKQERQWIHVAGSVFLWLTPMAGHWEHVAAGAAFFGSGVCTIPEVNRKYLGGWGHSVFHVGVACTAQWMCSFLVRSPP